MAEQTEQPAGSSNESQGASRRGSTDRSSSFKRTAGAQGAKAAKTADDLPLSVGPRDALVVDGHNDGDYVPDSEGKGYHVGMLRQPVMALVDKHGQIVGFEAVNESKFDAPGSLESLKAHHNREESSWKEGRNYRLASPEPGAANA